MVVRYVRDDWLRLATTHIYTANPYYLHYCILHKHIHILQIHTLLQIYGSIIFIDTYIQYTVNRLHSTKIYTHTHTLLQIDGSVIHILYIHYKVYNIIYSIYTHTHTLL